MTRPMRNKYTVFIKAPFAFTLGGNRGTRPVPLRLYAGYFPIFGQKEAGKQTLAFWPMYSVSIYFQVKPVWREGILRPWPGPFLPNLLRPKIRTHFTISRLRICIHNRKCRIDEEFCRPARQKITGILCGFQDFLTPQGG